MAHVSTVTIAASQVPADQTDFPALLPTPASDSAIWTSATSSGGDIRIFASDGTTEWAREIVSFDATAKTCEIWVKVPYLSSWSDTVIQIHADGASSDYAVTATYGRNAVWTDYAAVWHLGDLSDSTGNLNTLTAIGSPSVVDGPIGKGYDLTTTSGKYLRAADSAGLNLGSGSYTIQIAMRHLTASASFAGFQSLIDKAPPSNDSGYRLLLVDTDGFRIRQPQWTASNLTSSAQTWALNSDDWIYSTFDGTTRSIYRNGSSIASDSPSVVTTNNAMPFYIGYDATGGGNDGQIIAAESRARKAHLSGTWITTEYNNQSAPNTFATWVDEAAGSPPTLGNLQAFDITTTGFRPRISLT